MKFIVYILNLILLSILINCSSPTDKENKLSGISYNLSNSDTEDYAITYSLASQKILFHRILNNSDSSSLWIMDFNGKNQKKLSLFSYFRGGLHFSNDGTEIIQGIEKSIVKYNLENNTIEEFMLPEEYPSIWVNDVADTKVLYTSYDPPVPSVCLIDFNDNTHTVLADSARGLLFMHGGCKILFQKWNSYECHFIDIDGSNIMQAPFNMYNFVLGNLISLSSDSLWIIVQYDYDPAYNVSNSGGVILSIDGTTRNNCIGIPAAFNSSSDRVLSYTFEGYTLNFKIDNAIYISDLNNNIKNEFIFQNKVKPLAFRDDNSIIYTDIENNQIYVLK